VRATRFTRQIVVRVDEHLYGAILDDAECSGRTVAQTVRFLVRRELDGAVCDRCGAALRAREGG